MMKKLVSTAAAVIIGGAIALSGATAANADTTWNGYGSAQYCQTEQRAFQQAGYTITKPCYNGVGSPRIWHFKYVLK